MWQAPGNYILYLAEVAVHRVEDRPARTAEVTPQVVLIVAEFLASSGWLKQELAGMDDGLHALSEHLLLEVHRRAGS